MSRILVIDDEEGLRLTFKTFLSAEGYDVATASNYEEGMRDMAAGDFDLIFADIILEGKTGIDVLREVKRSGSGCVVVMVTGAPNVETAAEAVRLGAFDYLPKPVRKQTLLRVTDMALRHKDLSEEKEKYRKNLEAIFRSVTDAIITVDDDLTLLELNDSAEALCGLSRHDIGNPFGPAKCGGKCRETLGKTLAEDAPVKEYRMECGNGGNPPKVVTVSTYPLMGAKKLPVGAVMVVRDETRLEELERNLGERKQFSSIIGGSEAMQKVYSMIESLKDVRTTVLVTGESGTGKELVADALHHRGARSSRPLVKVNCSALPENLLESELFGHVRGAFTGALRDKVGRFERADGGTIFLDEIGDISPSVQLRLLRVLQETEFERVGDSTPVKVDVRVVAATNTDLKEKVRLGQFREDLYYRLKVVEINIPPLRERREDIPILAEHFLDKFNKKFNMRVEAVSEEAMRLLMSYRWPGNVRELEHAIEHACVLGGKPAISPDDLPGDLKSPALPGGIEEPQRILDALEKANWKKAAAARLLGISRPTLYQKIKEHNLQRRNS